MYLLSYCIHNFLFFVVSPRGLFSWNSSTHILGRDYAAGNNTENYHILMSTAYLTTELIQ